MSVQVKIDKRPMPSEALMRRVAAKLDIEYTSPHDILLKLARKTGCNELARIENLNRYALAFLAGGTYAGHEHDTEIHRRNYTPAPGYTSPVGLRAADYAARCEAAPLGRQDYLAGYRSRRETEDRDFEEIMAAPVEPTEMEYALAHPYERWETVGPK
jgi:hypothetical protein